MTSMDQEKEVRMFGCTLEDLRRGVEDSLAVKLNAGGYQMVAMSILSDAQELIAMGHNERARQEMNKAKWIIQQYLANPVPRGSTEKHYAITGRIPGDDEDTTLYVGQHPDLRSALLAFNEEMASKLTDEEKAAIAKKFTWRDGVYVYPCGAVSSSEKMECESVDLDSIKPVDAESVDRPAMIRSLDELKVLWGQLSDVPIDGEDCLDGDFLHFESGTPREDVWAWFESQHPDFSVAEMQGSRQRPRSN